MIRLGNTKIPFLALIGSSHCLHHTGSLTQSRVTKAFSEKVNYFGASWIPINSLNPLPLVSPQWVTIWKEALANSSKSDTVQDSELAPTIETNGNEAFNIDPEINGIPIPKTYWQLRFDR